VLLDATARWELLGEQGSDKYKDTIDESKVTSSGLRSASRGNLIVTAVAGGLGVGVLAQSADVTYFARNCHPTCSFLTIQPDLDHC
jgi:hypothetical protein